MLDRAQHHRGIDPPIDVMPSLSRLFDQGTGEGFTDADHPALAHQLFASCAHAARARARQRGRRRWPDRHRPRLQCDDGAATDPSPEAEAAARAFAALHGPLATLAASAGNLQRLFAEYRRTERRARALENVLLPEVDAALRAINEHLDLADQEEAVRTRLARR